MHHVERIGLRYPAVIVDRTRPVALPRGVDLINRDDLARLWLGKQIIVLEAPPGGRIAAKSAPLERSIAAGAGPHLEHVARLSVPHKDGAGTDVNAEPLASPAPVD